MNKFKSEQETQSGICKAPPLCGRSGCNEDTNIALIVVMDAKGNYRSGPVSSFGGTKENGYSLNDKYQFIEWVSRCAFHYLEEITRHRGIDCSPINVPTHEMTPEQVDEARRHFLGVAKKFISGSSVKRDEKNVKSGKWTEQMEQNFKKKALNIGVKVI